MEKTEQTFWPTELLYISFYVCLFIYFWLCWVFVAVRAFSSCSEWELLFVVVRRLLTVVASRCGAQALGTQASLVVARELTSCGSWALERSLSSCGARA